MTICIVDHYFSINKILFRAVALWPYHRTRFNEFQWFFFLVILITFILAELTPFLTTECTPYMAIKIFSFALSFTIFLIKFISFRINADTIRYLLEKFQYICDEITDEDEIAIIKEYGYEAKRFTLIVSVYGVSNAITSSVLPVVPRILRTFTSINVSDEHFMIHITREYFVDQEKYFYYILLHLGASFLIGTIVIVGTGSLLFGCMKYMCGLFRIASYRIDQTMETPMFQSAGLSKDCVTYKNIERAIDIHRKAIELHQVIMLKSVIKEYIPLVSNIIGTLVYVFINSYVGQEITDHHNHMFISVYNAKWYRTPLYIQRIILLLLQKGTGNYYVVFGGIFVLSMENAATLLSTSISYFTVLSSVQNP
ncbi:hypothetical protein X777_15257 [Ooceraea biroi]|uniref:Odorant receptor n=1 Tax=Ooceraea biroi TaxID=2015173 RepID=A0A026VVT2_OOCBI|nr:hypothetical protein X777_15257 [Ooceraea biroi]